MIVTPSDSESRRFGLRVGRMVLDGGDDVAVLGPLGAESYDVVIVRHSADRSDLAVPLALQDDYVALHADTLMYWAWHADDAAPGQPSLRSARRLETDLDAIGALVRDVFAGYGNHYAANPLFGSDDALEGYVEWATGLVASGAATCLVADGPAGAPVGFGAVDWSVEPPDVRLAGVCSDARGEGWYPEVIRHLMFAAQERPATGLQISTQAHNVVVQRTWARLGWTPRSATTTTHLVRRGLLEGR